jgi:hypothetical protein
VQRIILPERPDWRDKARAVGFGFHEMYGEPYWFEAAAYAFTLAEIEDEIEAPTEALHDMCMALVGEVAELSGLHTRQIEWIKKFVVRKTEKWIPKYKEFATTFARRLVFIGTTNRTDILADDTGNRRWLPLHITKADVEGIVSARNQLWAEGAVLFAQHGVNVEELSSELVSAPMGGGTLFQARATLLVPPSVTATDLDSSAEFEASQPAGRTTRTT